MPEKVETIEFNSMVAVLISLDKITNSMNESRRMKDIESLYEDLKSYYMTIYPNMTTDERKEVEEIFNLIKIHIRNPSGLVKTKKYFLLDNSEKLEKLLRIAAMTHGFLTKNIRTDIIKAL